MEFIEVSTFRWVVYFSATPYLKGGCVQLVVKVEQFILGSTWLVGDFIFGREV
jgi:hypothetical protein